MQRYYRPSPFRKQLQGSTPCSNQNCNMCTAANIADRLTLGGQKKSCDYMRKVSGYPMSHCYDNILSNNGTTLANAVTSLAHIGINATAFDRNDNKGWAEVVKYLEAGRPVAAHGEYDAVPMNLRGDKVYKGYHAVLFNEINDAHDKVFVWDSLNDGRRPSIPNGPIWWPTHVAKAYMDHFIGTPFTFLIVPFWRAEVRTEGAKVRSGPHLTDAVLRTMHTDERLQRGSHVHGTNIGGSDVWYRVWEPTTAKVGYIHASVINLLF